MLQPWLLTLKLRTPRAGFTQHPIGPVRSPVTFVEAADGSYNAVVEPEAAAYLLRTFPTMYEMVAPWAPLELVLELKDKVDAICDHLGVTFEKDEE